jgi:hypothetical protein
MHCVERTARSGSFPGAYPQETPPGAGKKSRQAASSWFSTGYEQVFNNA